MGSRKKKDKIMYSRKLKRNIRKRKVSQFEHEWAERQKRIVKKKKDKVDY